MIKNKILKNASWIVICRIGRAILSLVVTMLTARYLGPSNYGLIDYAAAVVTFLIPIVQLGLGNIEVLELVERPDEEGKTIGTILLSSFLMSILGVLGVFVFTEIANAGETETIIVCVLYSIILLLQSAVLMEYWFQYKYCSKYYAIISLVAFFVISLYKIFLLVTGKNVYWFAVSNAIDYVLILIASMIAYKKMGGQKLSFSFELFKKMFAKSKHYILANLMLVIFTQTDRIMIKLMVSSEATGYYSAAATCVCMFNFVFNALQDSARPTIFESLKISNKKFEYNVSILYSALIYSTLLLSILFTIFADLIIKIIYGADYMPAANVLRILAWYLPFSYIGSVRNIWLLATNKQKWLPLINGSGAVANVILNLIFIPIWGIYGAAFASLITQIFSNVIISYLIKDIRDNSRLMLRGCNIKFALGEAKEILKKGRE